MFERIFKEGRHDTKAPSSKAAAAKDPQASFPLSFDDNKSPDRKQTDDLTPANSRLASKAAVLGQEARGHTEEESGRYDRFTEANTPASFASPSPFPVPANGKAAATSTTATAAVASQPGNLSSAAPAEVEATKGEAWRGHTMDGASGAATSSSSSSTESNSAKAHSNGGTPNNTQTVAKVSASVGAGNAGGAAAEQSGSRDASAAVAGLIEHSGASESGDYSSTVELPARTDKPSSDTQLGAAEPGEAAEGTAAASAAAADDDSDLSTAVMDAEAADEAGELPDMPAYVGGGGAAAAAASSSSSGVSAASGVSAGALVGGRGRSRSRGHSSHRQPHSLLADTDSESDLSTDDEFNHNKRTNRYGFFETSDRAGPELPREEVARRSAKEVSRAGKWLAMYVDWDKTRLRRRRRLKRRVRKGVPDAMRGEVWQLLSGAKAAMQEHPGSYRALLEQELPVDGPIEEDLPRTMYDHEMFCRHSRLKGRLKLRRVLTAYGRYDREVQYCQGINYICAMFLLYMPEEEAFWQLASVMDRPVAPMRDLFLPGMVAAQEFQYVIDSLTEKYAPRFSRQITGFGLTPSMYATQWFLTGFTQRFPYDMVTHIWDIFLLEDWKIMYRVCLALFRHSEGAVAGLEIEPMNLFLRDLPTAVDGEAILALAFDIPLKRRHIEKRRRTFWAERGVPFPENAKGNSSLEAAAARRAAADQFVGLRNGRGVSRVARGSGGGGVAGGGGGAGGSAAG